MKVIEISCLEVWREISDYVDGDIDAELRARMEAHFKVCAHCKAVVDGTTHARNRHDLAALRGPGVPVNRIERSAIDVQDLVML